MGGPILVLQPVREMERIDEAYRLLIRGDLHLTVHDVAHLDDLQRLAERFATVIPLHLEIDTGMSRGGCSPDEASSIAQRIAELTKRFGARPQLTWYDTHVTVDNLKGETRVNGKALAEAV